MRPLLLLDIDGVLNPLTVSEAPGFMPHRVAGIPVLLNPQHGVWLRELACVFELTWASSWERDSDLIADLIGAPSGLPFVTFTRRDDDWLEKLPDVGRYVGCRSCAWVDDAFGWDVRSWAASRPAPTLLIKTDHRVGLTLLHVARLRAFAG